MSRRCKYISCMILVVLGMVYVTQSLVGFSASNDRAAEIKSVAGEVYVKKSGGEKSLKAFVGMSLTKGDTLITGKKASAVLKSGDDLEFIVSENTIILISELRKSADGKSITKVELKTGGLWSRIKKALFPGSQYEVKTPTVVLGARGTEFYTYTFNQRVTGDVFVGTVYVTYYEQTGKVRFEFILPAGKRVIIEGEPEKISDLMIQAIEVKNLDLFGMLTLKKLVTDNPLLIPYLDTALIDDLIESKTLEQKAFYEAYEERLEAAEATETTIEFYEGPGILVPGNPVDPTQEQIPNPIDNPTGGP